MNTHYCLALLIVLYTNTMYAKPLVFTNQQQMKSYALKQCILDRPNDCDCIAHTMIDKFTKQDWQIFIASLNKDESIKNKVSEKDIFDFSDKLYNVVLDCGIE